MMRKEMNPNRKTAIIVGVFYIVSALGLLSLLTLSQEYVKAGSPPASYFQILGALILCILSIKTHSLMAIRLGFKVKGFNPFAIASESAKTDIN
ncbi:MAG TPA: hypothetical protein VIO58_02240 [Candidatus Methanoperedens sp.]